MENSIKMKDLKRLLNDKQSDEIQLNMKTKKLKDDNFEVSLSGMVLNKTQLKELGLAEPQPRKKEGEVKETKAPKWAQELISSVKSIEQDVNGLKQNYSKMAVEMGKIDERLSVIESLDSIKREINSKKRVNELTKK